MVNLRYPTRDILEVVFELRRVRRAARRDRQPLAVAAPGALALGAAADRRGREHRLPRPRSRPLRRPDLSRPARRRRPRDGPAALGDAGARHGRLQRRAVRPQPRRAPAGLERARPRRRARPTPSRRSPPRRRPTAATTRSCSTRAGASSGRRTRARSSSPSTEEESFANRYQVLDQMIASRGLLGADGPAAGRRQRRHPRHEHRGHAVRPPARLRPQDAQGHVGPPAADRHAVVLTPLSQAAGVPRLGVVMPAPHRRSPTRP